MMQPSLSELDSAGADPAAPRRPIRSFVIRRGRTTPAQEAALERLAPELALPFEPRELDLDRVFGRRAPRVVEIGFGTGENLVALAAQHPERDFLGIEVHDSGVGRLFLAAEKLGLRNIRAIRHDAVEVLQKQIARDSLAEVLVLFPDPWPKKRHHKRRLIQTEFAALLISRLESGGVLRMATDWLPYADHMLEVMSSFAELENLAPHGRFIERPDERKPTRFEKRGTRLGHEVRDLAFRKQEAGTEDREQGTGDR